jgi:hypothetical protein
LWRDRIPLGKLTVLDGDPGLGKSTLLLDLAARVTTGSPMPDGAPTDRGLVILATGEDGIADTVRPRFDAAGGDAERLNVLEAVRDERGVRPLSLPEDVDALRAALLPLKRARLIIVDPFVAFLANYVNTRIDHDVRRTLTPLASLAAELDAAIVLLRHLNKATGPSALYRGGGSIGIIGAARAGLLAARDPDDETRRVLAVTKSNLGPAAASLAFTVEGAANGAGCVRWLGESAHRANDLVHDDGDSDERATAQDLRAFIREMVETTPRTQREATAAIRAAGFTVTDRTVQRARKAAGVAVKRHGFGPGSTVIWALENGHTRHIPVIDDIPAGVSGMSGMVGYDASGNGRGDAWEAEP